MEQYQNVVQDLAGNVVPQAVVRVLLSDGGANAIIYDSNGAQTSNPTPCDTEGYFAFQAANGKYFLQVEVANRVYKKLGPATLFDPVDDFRLSQVFNEADPRRYAIPRDGNADDSIALQQALDRVQNNTAGGMVEIPYGSKLKLKNQLTVDTNKCGINWNGVLVDASSLAAGSQLLNIIQSEPDVNRRPALNKMHPFDGGTYVGPGAQVNSTISNLQDLSGSQVIAGVTFSNGGCWGWSTGFTLGQGSFFTAFSNFDFAAVSGTSMGICISIPNAINSGEKNEFEKVRFGLADAYLVQSNGNADTHFKGVSFNYADRMMTLNAGKVFMSNWHVEGQSDVDYWIYVTGSNTVLNMSKGDFVIAGAKTQKELIYCDASVTHGGVFLDGYGFDNNSVYTLDIVGGGGRTQARDMTNYANGAQPTTSKYLNTLAYGDFESANFTSDWVLSGPTPPARSTVNPKTGTYSLRFAGIAGQNNAAVHTYPCRAGQLVAVNLSASVTGYGTGGNFYGTWAFLDKAGNPIGPSGAPLNMTGNTAYTRINFGTIPSAPPGTAFFQLAISFFNVITGTPFGDLDNVVVNVI